MQTLRWWSTEHTFASIFIAKTYLILENPTYSSNMACLWKLSALFGYDRVTDRSASTVMMNFLAFD